MSGTAFSIGDTTFTLRLDGDDLVSLGAPVVKGVALRSDTTRFLPWFDTFEGEVFKRFRLRDIIQRGATTVIRTTAISDPDVLFRERRDSSGDLCFRNEGWDAIAHEAAFDICLEPATDIIDGRAFSGFRYWFAYQGEIPIHRLVDRQTWEVGGNLDDLNLCLRNWLTPPRMRLEKSTTYSTIGLGKWLDMMQGNLWGRWSLLPGFDMQYGAAGVTVARFDRISLIRSLVESNAGEDGIRYLDMHLFPQAKQLTTNAKTVLSCADHLDHTAALNLWTRMQDDDLVRGQAQYGIPREPPPAIVFAHNVWGRVHFDTTYEDVVQVASEFSGDAVFIDCVFEHEQAYAEHKRQAAGTPANPTDIESKVMKQNMCCFLDFAVNDIWGGEQALKRLCDRAAAKQVQILTLMATMISPNSYLNDRQHPLSKTLGGGAGGVIAMRESGRHPDTGHPGSCWPLNLHTPVFDWLRERLLGICQRTGMGGFLWGDFSNMCWWQIDYSQGTMAPQVDKVGELYADLVKAGLYIQPESLTGFSTHSCCGLHAGNIYADDLLGYSYNTTIALWFGESEDPALNFENRILRGEEPIDLLFQCFAHKRVPNMNFHRVARDQWHAASVVAIKTVLAGYVAQRHRMIHRTVLADGRGVRWDGDDRPLLFAFADGPAAPGTCDADTGLPVTMLSKNCRYLLSSLEPLHPDRT